MKGMRVSVYRNAQFGDATNGGITSQFTQVVLVGEGIPENTEPTDDCPALLLKKKDYYGEYLYAEPAEERPRFAGTLKGPWYMAGGNFVYSTDSRFRKVCKYPIAVHDRTES